MKITNLRVYGLESAIIASSYPMLTKPLTELDFLNKEEELLFDSRLYDGENKQYKNEAPENNKDFERMKKLCNTPVGSGHNVSLQGVTVQFDVDFTIKAWTEAQRYHFLDFVSSTSTMHRLTSFELDSSYVEYVDDRMVAVMKELQSKYNVSKSKEDYLALIYSNPVGMKLTARMTTNYRQLEIIVKQRQNHKLPEWREFCEYMKENLPLFKELCYN